MKNSQQSFQITTLKNRTVDAEIQKKKAEFGLRYFWSGLVGFLKMVGLFQNSSFLIFVATNCGENYLYKLFVSDHFQETDQI